MDKLLPHSVKNIALISLLILGIIWLTGFTPAAIFELESENALWVLKDLFLLCLLLLSFSKEKQESEAVRSLRYKKLAGAVIFAALSISLGSLYSLIIGSGIYKQVSGYEILVILLIFYLLTFNFAKFNQQ
ncbi:hypothetical protein [Christiangramia salexigens]|uniref:Uncharacterized protein n=1 Tax=Christiangramia salexigens TaxID=1913577 RepID=A0A1L3J467_9FLAO|nr:hypothetical protein [Christiangramia salexigens]APG59902.1 hypothetical protein LPB144_05505 [Christiangramia salexigens]